MQPRGQVQAPLDRNGDKSLRVLKSCTFGVCDGIRYSCMPDGDVHGLGQANRVVNSSCLGVFDSKWHESLLVHFVCVLQVVTIYFCVSGFDVCQDISHIVRCRKCQERYRAMCVTGVSGKSSCSASF